MPADGLDALTARRARRTRQAPPPRHPRRDDLNGDPTPDLEAQEAEALTAVPDLPTAPPAEPAPVRGAPQRRPAKQAAPKAQPGGALRPAQFYIDTRLDDYLRDVRAASLRTRADVTASAVVRLALADLMERMTAEEVAAKLADAPATNAGAGRKRR